MLKKGDNVKLKVVVPQGVVAALRFNDDGEIEALFEWDEGEAVHQRWFKQDELEVI